MSEPAVWLDLDQLEQRLCIVTAEQLGLDPEEVKPESRLIEDLNCDSLDMIELIMETEDEFGITIPDNPKTPVGKLIFTRQPFRVRDLAEFAFLNQGTGAPVRTGWRKRKVEASRNAERDFTQLGGRLDSRSLSKAELVQFATAGEGYQSFRRSTDGMVCVQIPETSILLGSVGASAHPDEEPRHAVTLSPFLMDIEPVSVTAFCRFLNSIDGSHDEVEDLVGLPNDDDRIDNLQFSESDDGWRARNGTAMQPVVLVSWFAANAYSLWANGQNWRDHHSICRFLPSEAQWECAAEGSFDNQEAILAGQHERGKQYNDGILPIADVHQPYGTSRFGLRHMSGTVWHWCRDWFEPDFYRTPAGSRDNPVAIEPTGIRSERGGSWVGPIEICRPSYRRGRNPEARGRCLGFRCVGAPPNQAPA